MGDVELDRAVVVGHVGRVLRVVAGGAKARRQVVDEVSERLRPGVRERVAEAAAHPSLQLGLQGVVVGPAVGDDLLQERGAVAVLGVREDHRARADNAPLVQVAQPPAVADQVADAFDGQHRVRHDLELGPDAELVDDRRFLVRVLDAPLHECRVHVADGRRGEAVLEDQHRRRAGVGRGHEHVDELRRVERELALRPVAVGVLVVGPVAAPDHPLRRNRVGDRHPRRDVVLVGMDQRAIEDAAGRLGCELPAGGGIDVGHLVVHVEQGREVLVAGSIVDRQLAGRPPGVLGEELPAVRVEVGLVEERQALLRRQTQQEVADPGAGVAGVVEAQEAVQGAQVEVVHLVAAPFDAELPGVRAAVPGQVRRELQDLGGLELRPEEGSAQAREAADVGVRDPATVAGVPGNSRDAELRVGIVAEGPVEGVALDPVPGGAHLAERGAADRMRPAGDRALAGDLDVAVEVARGDRAQHRRLLSPGLHVAVAPEEGAAGARLGVEADVVLVDADAERAVVDVVRQAEAARLAGLRQLALDVGQGVQADQAGGDRVEAGRADPLVDRVDAARGNERVAGGQGPRQLDQVALPHQRGGDGGELGERLIGVGVLVVGEEEQLVLADRPADGGAADVLVVLAFRPAGPLVLPGIGVEGFVAEEAEDDAVDVVRALLDRGVDHRSGRAPELGGVVARRDAELLERIDRRLDDLRRALLQVGGERVVVGAVQGEVVPGRVVAVGVEERVLAAALDALARVDDAGLQQRQLRITASEQRQVGELALVDRMAHVAGLGLEQLGPAADHDLLADVSQREREVGLQTLLDMELDRLPDRLLEALQLDRDRVAADLEVGEHVLSLGVGHGREAGAGALLRRGDGGAGEDGPRRIRDGADDGGRVDLGAGRGSQQEDEGQREAQSEDSGSLGFHFPSPSVKGCGSEAPPPEHPMMRSPAEIDGRFYPLRARVAQSCSRPRRSRAGLMTGNIPVRNSLTAFTPTLRLGLQVVV